MSVDEQNGGRTVTIRLEFGRRQFVALLTLGLICFTPGDLVTEQLTLTTYYPSPYGVYEELRSTQNTYLSYTGGNTCIGSTSCSNKLQVNGNAYATNLTAAQAVAAGTNVSAAQAVSAGTNVTAGQAVTAGTYVQSGSYVRAIGNIYTTGGALGIGMTNPSHDIHVNKGGANWAMRIQKGSANVYFAHGGGYGAYIHTGGGDSAGRYAMIVRNNAREHIRIQDDSYILLGRTISNACRWYPYSVGTQRFCPVKWGVFAASTYAGNIQNNVKVVNSAGINCYLPGQANPSCEVQVLPTSGRILCCRLSEY